MKRRHFYADDGISQSSTQEMKATQIFESVQNIRLLSTRLSQIKAV